MTDVRAARYAPRPLLLSCSPCHVSGIQKHSKDVHSSLTITALKEETQNLLKEGRCAGNENKVAGTLTHVC
jgi:hypothetical protein